MADINVIVLPDGTEYPVSDYYLPVAISNPTNGQVLKYDATNDIWYNGDDAEGSSVFYGTSAPTSQLGVNGNLYVKYTEGTGGASDTVDDLYVKLDGAWCQISTGGGGTSDYNDLTNKPQINSVELSDNKSLDDLGIQSSEISKTATGSIASFSDGGDDIPVESFECEIVAQQESGTPTPANPLPITGFDSADIPVMGKNLFDESQIINASGWSESDGVYTGVVAQLYLYANNGFPKQSKYKENTQYTLSVYVNATDAVSRFRIYYTDGTYSDLALANNMVGTTQTHLTTPNKTIDKITFTYNSGGNLSISKIQLEENTTATTYVPYTGTLYTIDFGQTIYGGRLIYSNGQWAIEATHGYAEFDGSEDEDWIMSGGTNGTFIIAVSNAKLVNTTVPGDIIANIMTAISYNTGYYATNIFGIAMGYQSSQLRVNVDTSVVTKDLTTFRTWLSNNPLQAVYELATPVIIPLTSLAHIKTLPGVNNIFSNTGDSTVKYFTNNADKIAELVKAEIASTNTDYHKYSTEEKIVGEWIDGKTIYERTYTFTAPSSNAIAREDLGIPMSGISNAWIDIQNSFATNSTMCTNPTFYDGSPKADQFGCYLNFLQTNLAFDYRVGSDFYSSNIVLTIRYTNSS